MKEFLPVSTGNDLLTYSTARGIHEATDVTTVSLGIQDLRAVRHSAIVRTVNDDAFRGEENIVEHLMDFGRKQNGPTKPILFAGAESYADIFYRHPELEEVYHVPYNIGPNGAALQSKENFYKVCEEQGIRYPQTFIIDRETDLQEYADVRFPMVLKPEHTMDFRDLEFEGKWKVYKLETFAELEETVARIYQSSFDGRLMLQKFVAGPIFNEYSFSGYVDRDGNLRDVAIGRALTDDPHPDMRGNHLAIVLAEEAVFEPLIAIVQKYIRAVNYHGLINFDFKRDANDGEFYVFEVNQRQGASSYYAMMAGGNFYRGLVEDYVLEKPFSGMRVGREPFVWVDCSPKVVREHLSGPAAALFDDMASRGRVDHTLTYPADHGFQRRMNNARYLDVKDRQVEENFAQYPVD